MLSGAAPISADVLDFLKIASCSPILEGYLKFILRIWND
jgi:long-subunit acyl-CoA synthetase (AMP-forming)